MRVVSDRCSTNRALGAGTKSVGDGQTSAEPARVLAPCVMPSPARTRADDELIVTSSETPSTLLPGR